MIRVVVEQQDPDGQVTALAHATVANISKLAPVSDYQVEAGEHFNVLAGRPAWRSRGMIGAHRREQSVWALVARVAQWAAARAEEQG
jgi:hypothetical protein